MLQNVTNMTSRMDERSSAVSDDTENVVISIDPFQLNSGSSDQELLQNS